MSAQQCSAAIGRSSIVMWLALQLNRHWPSAKFGHFHEFQKNSIFVSMCAFVTCCVIWMISLCGRHRLRILNGKPFHFKTIRFWSCPLDSTFSEVVHSGWIWMAMDNLWIRSREFKMSQNLHFPTDSPDRIRDLHWRTPIQASTHLVSVSFLEQFHQSILC